MNATVDQNVVAFQSVAKFDEELLALTLERIAATSKTLIERLQNRPVSMKVPQRKVFAVALPAKSRLESLQWEIYLELDFIGAIAQATKIAPRKGRNKKPIPFGLNGAPK